MGWQKVRFGVLAVLLLASGGRVLAASTQANPYEPIVDRNVFGLKPPPEPPAQPPPPAPLAKITLTGITTILGNKLVLMKVSIPAKPPEPARELSLTLTEGQREGEIEVVSINDKTGDVKVTNGGQEQLLNIERDSPKPLVGAAPAPQAPVPTGAIHSPALNAAAQPGSALNPYVQSGKTAIPPRPARGGLPTLPSAGTPYPNSLTATAAQQNQPMTKEEQLLLMEAERERLKAASGRGELPPLPPAPITPQ